MECSSCHTNNPAEASFCMGCGAALALICPSCGTELPSEAQFCIKCGHKIAEAQPAQTQDRIRQYIPDELLAKLESAKAAGGMQGERRVVTMLFCDVQGSTAAAEKLDPEEWTEIMNGAFECLMPPVYRYEGTIARLMGDAILAFFGAPIGHEDDPQRAVLAGLDIIQAVGPYRDEIRAKWDIDFNVRIGINTGLVMVGEVGTDLRVEYTAMGDAVNLAARMEQTAEPGTVQITDDTYKLISPLFEFEELGGIEVKGKAEPITAYRVMGLKAEPGRLRGIEGLDSPLVGRESEMAKLREGIDSLVQGQGQIWSVMGEAGLGKSRLVAELRQALLSEGLLPGSDTGNGDAPALNWLEGRSLSYEASIPYAPFVDMFRTCFDLRPGETDAEQYRKVAAGVEGVMPDNVMETAPYIATVLGIKLEGDDLEMVRHLQPPQLRGRVFAATASYIEQVSVQRPLVLVFEDVHWVDPTSLELLEHLLPLTDRAALMIVAILRPQRQDASWRIHELAAREYGHRYTSILLEPLDQDNSRLLVANLLEVEDLPASVRELILEKAEGNPFFVEEVIRSLLDAGLVVREDDHWKATREIENITVPNTLAGVITARLDRLDEEPKRLAQTASVIGREFQFNTLEEVHEAVGEVDEALGQLQRRELVREKSRLPERVYIFKHVLTQETVYSSVLRSRRRELHLRIGECLERADPDNAGEIARHYLEAQENARALPYLVEVADRAARAYSTTEAIASYTRALEILETTDDLSLARRVYEGLGSALTFVFDIPKAVETYETMLRLAQESDDVPMQVSALNKLGFVAGLMQGQFPVAEKMLGDAARLAEESSDLPGLAECHMTYCYLRTAAGEFDDAVVHLSESAEIGRRLELEEPRLFGMVHTANTLTYMTRFTEAHEKADEAREVAEKLGNKKWLAQLNVIPDFFYHLVNGELDEAYETAKAGVEIAAQIGAAGDDCIGSFSMGQVAQMRGEYEQAIAHYERAVSAGRMAGVPFLSVAALCMLGAVRLEVSEKMMEQTTELHAEALKLMDMPLGSVLGAAAWADMGFCALAVGRLDEAEEMFQKGLTAPSSLKNLLRPQLLIGAASVAIERKNLDEAARLLGEAGEFTEARSMKHFYASVALAEGRLKAAQGDPEGALDRFNHAEGLALDMGMRPQVLQARAGAAQALSALGRDADAGAKREQAKAMINEIAGLFEDPDLRSMYVEGATGQAG